MEIENIKPLSILHFQFSITAIFPLCTQRPRLKGNPPVRGNVCNADKRVPVSGRKGARQGGEVSLSAHPCAGTNQRLSQTDLQRLAVALSTSQSLRDSSPFRRALCFLKQIICFPITSAPRGRCPGDTVNVICAYF